MQNTSFLLKDSYLAVEEKVTLFQIASFFLDY